MKHLISIALLMVTSVMLVGASSVDDAETIRAARTAFNEAIARHDIKLMQSFLAEDYVATISTGSIDRSRGEHMQNFASHFEQFPDVVYIRSPADIQISEAYPLAIERGSWVGSRTTENGALENGGEYTAAWKQTGDGWLIYSELFVGLFCRGEDC